MITSKHPEAWQELEELVADILFKCGMAVTIQKDLTLARGSVNVDVYAEHTVKGRPYRLLCECKYWSAPIPRTVIHAFRSVVSDSGSNFGYLISKNGFQPGALEAADFTNIKLLTWMEFQAEFEEEYFQNYFRSKIEEYVDPICTLTEPISPMMLQRAGRLDDRNMEEFLALKNQYEVFAHICLSQFPFMDLLKRDNALKLPLEQTFPKAIAELPPSIVGISGYEEFLGEAQLIVAQAYSEFQRVLYPLPPGAGS